MAALAAALTFGMVFWSVWELGQPWIRWGGLSHAGEVKGTAASDGGSGAWRIVSTGTPGPGVYVVGPNGRFCFYEDV
jgi:hypothetical protein